MSRSTGLWRLSIVCSVLLCASFTGHAQGFVIANPSVTYTQLSVNQLRAIFGMRMRTWPDGHVLVVAVLPDSSSSHITFCKQILNVFPYQLRRAWDRLVFSGTGQAPLTVSDQAAMLETIARTPGAIGYISGTVDDARIKILQID